MQIYHRIVMIGGERETDHGNLGVAGSLFRRSWLYYVPAAQVAGWWEERGALRSSVREAPLSMGLSLSSFPPPVSPCPPVSISVSLHCISQASFLPPLPFDL